MPPKSAFGDYDLCGANRLDRCSVCVDRIINRMELISTMSAYLHSCESRKHQRYDPMFDEMFNRLELLRQGATVRSVLVENDFVSIIGSNRLCQLMSDKRYYSCLVKCL